MKKWTNQQKQQAAFILLEFSSLDFQNRLGKLPETLPEWLVSVLQSSKIEGNKLFLTTSLSREAYQDFNELMKRLFAKWVKLSGKNEYGLPNGYFHFQYYEPKVVIQELIRTQITPKNNPLDFFPTPKKVVLSMLKYAEMTQLFKNLDNEYLNSDSRFLGKRKNYTFRVLEPSAGLGYIVDEVRNLCPSRKQLAIDVVELDPVRASVLKKKGYQVVGDDFLKYQPNYKYDTILMNPPFDRKLYQKHIIHAFDMLKSPTRVENEDAGYLVAIVPKIDIRSSQNEKFLIWLAENNGEIIEDLPRSTFAEAGTNVETSIILMSKVKTENDWRRKPYNGYPSYYTWYIVLLIENNYPEVVEQLEKLSKKFLEQAFTPQANILFEDFFSVVEKTIVKMKIKNEWRGYKENASDIFYVAQTLLRHNVYNYIEDFRYKLEEKREIFENLIKLFTKLH